VIEVADLCVSRGQRQVLHDVSFDAGAGECIAVVGPNGSGKSTVLAALAGDLPFRGRAQVAGQPVAGDQARLRAVMTQHTAVAFGFTVREVIAMARAPWHGTGTADARAIADAVAAADVEHLLDRGVQGLSGGELARVAFARLLAQTTPVMMLDEPTAALDLRHQVGLLSALRGRVAGGGTAVVVLHDLTLARAAADRVLVLDEGRVAAFGPPAEVLVPGVLGQVYGVAVEVLAEGRVVVPAAWAGGL
jgi:iron complex transport system ATP-binding protein